MKRALSAVIAAAALAALAQPAFADSIDRDSVWSGTVVIFDTLVVEKGATLTIEPGTTVKFAPGEPDETGLASTGMLVYGSIIARGGQGERITFTSAAVTPEPGDWGEIKIIEGPGSEFTSCDFRYGGWGIHTHDNALRVEDCTFTGNRFGGLRGKGGELDISGSSFHGMDIGIRYWLGSPRISGCTITGNDTGIFFRKGCEGASVHGNDIFGNREYDLKLGDAQDKDVDVTGNWWGSLDVAVIRTKIFDKERDPYIGRALIEPVLQESAAEPAGGGVR